MPLVRTTLIALSVLTVQAADDYSQFPIVVAAPMAHVRRRHGVGAHGVARRPRYMRAVGGGLWSEKRAEGKGRKVRAKPQ